ncbi:exodeoxyribonuclease VII large subunit, partial [Enterobacter hormaechei]|uniref:exodeoxyribonuclease VII large subunit n=1 Tax=Enterobacter hormaechei TaxID=158836 RepID=UPI002E29E0E5
VWGAGSCLKETGTVGGAVGHKRDVTFAVFVAVFRAPPPPAAAEVVGRTRQGLLRQTQNGQQRREMAMDSFPATRTRRFTQLHHRLQQQHPQFRLARQQTVLERLRQRMNFALDNQPRRAVPRQHRVTQRLNQQNPQPKIYRAQTRIQQLEFRLAENIRSRLST